MTNNRRVVKIFIGSPSDLPEERKIVKAVIDEINELHADDSGYQVELIGWEDTPSVYGRPQATINRELKRCELFLGLMWKRWGTPPDISGPYSSGFEEEYELSVSRRLREGRPEISLLFKDIDTEFLRDPGDELKRVVAFKTKIIGEKKLLYETFADSRTLEKKIRRCITKFIQELKDREANGITDQNKAPAAIGSKPQLTDISTPPPEAPSSTARAQYFHEFISKIDRDAEIDPITAVEVARFRLLANILCTQGNDENSLGVHDSNLLFAARDSVSFAYDELSGLVVSGLTHYSDQNAPLWHWLTKIEASTPGVFPLYSINSSIFSTALNVGALAAMRLISEPIPSDSPANRQVYLESWFADKAPVALKIAALSYLGEFGIISDLPTLYGELEKNNYRTSSAAGDAIIRIHLRESREKAISVLYELQPASISGNVLSSLFHNSTALNTNVLLGGVGHRNADVRGIVVKLLRERRALPDEIANQLLNDDDAKIRYEAVKSLIDNGRTFSNDEAERLINKQAPNHRSGLFITMLSRDDSEACWTNFQLERLRSLTDKELEQALAADQIFDQGPEFILAERHFKRRGNELRKSIDDQYKTRFAGVLDSMVEKYGGMAELVKRTRALENPLRKELTRKGLDVICRKAEAVDLARVRKALESDFIAYTYDDIEYMRRFGGWEDIPLIINLIRCSGPGHSNLLLPSDDIYKAAARAICTLGRKRLAEVLAMPAPARLISNLIVEISDKDFYSLDNPSISPLFKSEDETVRKLAAIKCIRALPKKRLVNLLADYLMNQPCYYNVIHWLDFGVSIPKTRTFGAANSALNQYLPSS